MTFNHLSEPADFGTEVINGFFILAVQPDPDEYGQIDAYCLWAQHGNVTVNNAGLFKRPYLLI